MIEAVRQVMNRACDSMSIIESVTFQLADGTQEETFLLAVRQPTEFLRTCPASS